MKQRILLVLAMFLTLAGIQTAMAQTMTVHLANDEKVTYDVSQVDSVTFNKSGQQPQEDIIVTVDANGNADGGHHFDWIDNTNFYIDDVKYTAKDGNLVVTGYDPAFFQGEAKLITRLILVGRRMNVVEISEKAFYQCQVLKSVVIPKYVTSIGNDAFYSCTGLTSITIPNSVTTIGNSAFGGCSNLTSITIPNSVTSIGYWAFGDCSVTSITIPNSVTSIGECAFYGCTSLTSVTIKAKTPPTIGISSFSNASNATLYVPLGCKAAYQAASYWKNFKEIIEIEMED